MPKVSSPNSSIVILLLEPARGSRAQLASAALAKKGYRVVQVATAKRTVAQAHALHPTLAVLDCTNGRSKYAPLCHDLRRECQDLPILVIKSEKSEVETNLPANVAILVAPFTARKLLNRVTRLLPQPDGDMLRVGDVILYLQRRCLRCRGVEHRLTPMQARLAEVFLRHPGEVLSRRFLIKEVWETDYIGDTRTLDVHIRWLRQFIEDDPSNPHHIMTVRGVGYRFVIPDPPNV